MSNQYHTYRYLKLPWLGRTACITAAITVNLDTKEASVGYAFCSPSEKEFRKKRARDIADGRLACHKTRVVTTLPAEVGVSRSLNNLVFTDILLSYNKAPRWVSRAMDDIISYMLIKDSGQYCAGGCGNATACGVCNV